MAVRPTDPEALQLYQLIGAPLLAVVQAEAQAAQVSAEFIKTIGFSRVAALAADSKAPANSAAVGPDAAVGADAPNPATVAAGGPAPPKPGTAAVMTDSLQDGGNVGDLKMAQFRMERVAADGTPQVHMVSVPVLSLFPIPLLQVKDAQFDFDIHVLTRVGLANDTDQHAGAVSPAVDFLARNRVELKGLLASAQEEGAGATATNQAKIKVRVRMEQSDLPAGLIRLMTMMGEGVTSAPLTPVDTVRPPEK